MADNSYENWFLTDLVINDYLQLIEKRDPKNIHVFDSFFFERLTLSGYEGVKRWTRKKNIFSKSKIFIPININNNNTKHWVLVYVNMIKKRIYYYDSLFRHDKFQYSFSIFNYLKNEHREKLHRSMDLEKWKFSPAANPFQENGIDCGVFILTFAEYLSRDARFNFHQSHMVSFRHLIWYELTVKKLISIDQEVSNVDEFIQRVIM